MCSNLAKDKFNLLFAKFPFGMKENGQKTIAVRGSSQKGL